MMYIYILMYESMIRDSIWLKFEYLNLVHQAYCNVTCRLYRHRVQRGLRSRVGWGTKSSEKSKNQRSWDDQSRLVSSDWMIGWLDDDSWRLEGCEAMWHPPVRPTSARPSTSSEAKAAKVSGAIKKKGEALASPKIFPRGFCFLLLLLEKLIVFFFCLWVMVVPFSPIFFLEGNLIRNILINKQSIYFFVECIHPM